MKVRAYVFVAIYVDARRLSMRCKRDTMSHPTMKPIALARTRTQ